MHGQSAHTAIKNEKQTRHLRGARRTDVFHVWMGERMKTKNTKSFASRWGFILASVGSAVGMANVWGFPNKLGSNGGGAFLLIYLLFVVIFGTVGLPTEFAMGRRAGTGTLGAYKEAWGTRGKTAGKVGGLLGWLPLAGSLCIAIGYAVIVTYILKALVDSLLGTLMTGDAAVWFASFSTQPYSVIPYHIIVVAGTLLTLFFGAHSIEKTNKVMMPLFFIIFVVLAVRVALLPGSAEGYKFMFTPALGGAQGPDDLDLGYGSGVFLPVRHRQRHDRLRRVPVQGRGRRGRGAAHRHF